jgi:hypothetical protein
VGTRFRPWRQFFGSRTAPTAARHSKRYQGNNTPLLLLSLAMIVGIVVIFLQTAQSRLPANDRSRYFIRWRDG